jgi:hypothetical protein
MDAVKRAEGGRGATPLNLHLTIKYQQVLQRHGIIYNIMPKYNKTIRCFSGKPLTEWRKRYQIMTSIVKTAVAEVSLKSAKDYKGKEIPALNKRLVIKYQDGYYEQVKRLNKDDAIEFLTGNLKLKNYSGKELAIDIPEQEMAKAFEFMTTPFVIA